MNLIEAHRTGRSIACPPWTHEGRWYRLEWQSGNMPVLQTDDGGGYMVLPHNAFDRDDWITKEPEVTITAKQFWDAYKAALGANEARNRVPMPPMSRGYSYSEVNFTMNEMARKLGLMSET